MIGGDGDNYITVAPGANYKLGKSHIDKIENVIEKAGMIVMQYEILTSTLEEVLKIASEKGTPTMLNFAPAKFLDNQFLSKVSILVVNETEAQYLTKMPSVSPDKAADAAQILRDKGINTIIITLGINGSYILSNDFTGFVPSFKVDAVDATAAGDVYCGTLAASLIEGKSMKEAVRFSSAAAALCVTKLGAQPSAPYRNEIDNFIKNKNKT